MPTLFKRSNGIYYTSTIEQGKRRWRSTGEKHKDLALKKIFSSQKSIPEVQSTSLKTFISQFLEYAQGVYSEGTVEIYKKSLARFFSHAGNLSLSCISERHIDMFEVSRLKEISAITLNIELRTLRAAFYTAKRWKLINENPFKNVPLCKIDEQAPVHLSLTEFKQLIQNIREKWLKDICVFAIMTGMRRSEITNLRWSNVDLRSKIIIIQSHGRFRAKCGKKRNIPMNNSVFELLSRIRDQGMSEYVFTLRNEKINGRFLTRKFKFYVRKTGLDDKLHFHSLRHSFATWLVEDGVSIYEIQKLLGHSNINVTMIYSHLATEHLHHTVERISVTIN